MKKLVIIIGAFIMASVMTVGCVSGKETESIHSPTPECNLIKIKWQEGFTKTEFGTYIPESYDVLYKTLKTHKNYQDLEKLFDERCIFNEQEVKELIARKNKLVPQDYPPGTMLSPYHESAIEESYENAILFIPNTTLDKTKNSNIGLSDVQYQAILKDIAEYEKTLCRPLYSKPNEIEVMEVSCKLSQIPSQIQIITRLPIIIRQFLPEPNISDKNTMEVFYPTAVKTNLNSRYLYVTNEDGGCVSVAGTYDKEGKLNKEAYKMPVNKVDKVIYLFFIQDNKKKCPNRDSEPHDIEWFYRPKIVVFNIEQ